jgi:hypothetical protein
MVQRCGEVHINKGRVGEERRGKETDGCPLTDKDLYLEAEAKPVPWKHREQNRTSSCQPLCDFPRSFYNDMWCNHLNANFHNCTLQVSKKQFEHVAVQG